jgi:hypothetical protein
MPARQLISLIALSVLIALPSGVAKAGDIDVQDGNSRVRITQDGSVIVNSLPTRTTTIIRRNLPIYNNRVKIPVYGGSRYRVLKPGTTRVLPTRNLQCSTRQNTIRNSSGGSSTYSSTTTQTCR